MKFRHELKVQSQVTEIPPVRVASFAYSLHNQLFKLQTVETIQGENSFNSYKEALPAG